MDMYNVYEYVHTFRSPEMFAPARMPVAAGKKTANTVKKLCSVPSNLRKSGKKLVRNVSPTQNTCSYIIPFKTQWCQTLFVLTPVDDGQ